MCLPTAHSWNFSQVIKKDVNISVGHDTNKDMLEKQNWYYRDHLGNIPTFCVDRDGEKEETLKQYHKRTLKEIFILFLKHYICRLDSVA